MGHNFASFWGYSEFACFGTTFRKLSAKSWFNSLVTLKLRFIDVSRHLFRLISQLGDGDHDGLGVLAVPPLVGRDGGNVGAGVRVKVLLEELRLAGYHEGDDLAEAVVVDAKEPGNRWRKTRIKMNKELSWPREKSY